MGLAGLQEAIGSSLFQKYESSLVREFELFWEFHEIWDFHGVHGLCSGTGCELTIGC